MSIEDEAEHVRKTGCGPITNRMEDCGDDRHVGWRLHKVGLIDQALLIEVKPETVMICCCEGERPRTRISFVTGHAQAVEITCALMKALGIEGAAHAAAIPAPLRAITRAAWTEELRRARQALADQGGHHAALEGLIVVLEAALVGLGE